jgi:hypothetical protein
MSEMPAAPVRWRTLLLVAACFSLAGCSTLAQWMGLRVRLDKLPITGVSAYLVQPKGAARIDALAPGQSARLVIVATDSAGTAYVTVGAGGGKVAFDNYTVSGTLAALAKGGRISLPADARVTDGKTPDLKITVISHPQVTTDLVIPLRYDVPFVADYSGRDGSPGFDGMNGLDGSPGQDAPAPTVDPTTGVPGTQGPGGRGGDGGPGGDGGDGGPGSPGKDVQVFVTRAPGERVLLQAKVSSGAAESFYLIDPSGGTLTVLSNGGRGGRAGVGGRGGAGGVGGSGFPTGFSGISGRNGFDGRPGPDAPGGHVTLTIDPAASAYQSLITWSNHGGSGAAGPTATVETRTVGPLW